jgi:Na+/proline symporter
MESAARDAAKQAQEKIDSIRKQAAAAVDPKKQTSDSDYVFITFILGHLPHGLIGLLIAAFFAAALSAKAAELNALASTTTIDIYRHIIRAEAANSHYLIASKCFTVMWGMIAILFALFAAMAENLIQAVNIVGSIFYPVILGLFMVGFFLKWVGGTATFWGALLVQILVIALYFSMNGYLWYNLIGCVACMLLSVLLQAVLPRSAHLTGPSFVE